MRSTHLFGLQSNIYNHFYSIILWVTDILTLYYRLRNVFIGKLEKQYVGHFLIRSCFKSLYFVRTVLFVVKLNINN